MQFQIGDKVRNLQGQICIVEKVIPPNALDEKGLIEVKIQNPIKCGWLSLPDSETYSESEGNQKLTKLES